VQERTVTDASAWKKRLNVGKLSVDPKIRLEDLHVLDKYLAQGSSAGQLTLPKPVPIYIRYVTCEVDQWKAVSL
jgi:hypothetical protein